MLPSYARVVRYAGASLYIGSWASGFSSAREDTRGHPCSNGWHRCASRKFPTLIREAIDFVLDPVRTARTQLGDLDKIEKTFIGLKVEHFVRDMLDVPKGVRDLRIAGVDVDIKYSVKGDWMIPPETFSREEPCLVIASDENTHQCWLGLIIARQAYLNAPNRDGKRSVSAAAFRIYCGW